MTFRIGDLVFHEKYGRGKITKQRSKAGYWQVKFEEQDTDLYRYGNEKETLRGDIHERELNMAQTNDVNDDEIFLSVGEVLIV